MLRKKKKPITSYNRLTRFSQIYKNILLQFCSRGAEEYYFIAFPAAAQAEKVSVIMTLLQYHLYTIGCLLLGLFTE